MKTVQIRCIKDGYLITKGKLYDITTWNKGTAQKELDTNKRIVITDDKGGKRGYYTNYFISTEDKQTWRDIQLNDLIIEEKI